MDLEAGKLLFQLGTYGPLGIMSALFFILFISQKKDTALEREKADKLSEKLYELGMASIRADMEHSKAYEPMERIMDAAIKALSERSPTNDN